PRALECSFWSAECDFTLNTVKGDKKDLSITTNAEESIVFSTKGSYIDYNIGTKLHVYYNKNLTSSDEFAFTFAQNAGFTAVLEFNIKAEAKSLSDKISFEENFKPIGEFEIEIMHPHSLTIKTSVIVVPTITLGIGGKLSGSIAYKTDVNRTGEIRVAYDSRNGKKDLTTTMKDTSSKLGKDALNVALEASVSAYCYPNMTFIPSVKPLRIKYPITLVELRAGIKLNNTLTGKIAKGFVASNDGVLISDNSEVSVISAVSGLAQGKFSAKIGENIVFYESKDFTNILQTPEWKIFEWKMQVIADPKIIVKDDASNSDLQKLSFSNDDKSINTKLIYYYTLSDKDDTSTDIDLTKLSTYSTYTSESNEIEISENTIVKVIAVLNNADVSKTSWSFGQSASKQVKKEISNVIEPTILPGSKVFAQSMIITLTQSQNYDIYYKLNGGTSQLYSNPFDITEATNISAYTSTLLDGKKILSKEVRESYTMCAEDEVVESGACVHNSLFDNEDTSSNVSILQCPTQLDTSLDINNNLIFHLNADGTITDDYPINGDYHFCDYYDTTSLLAVDRLYIDYKLEGITKEYYTSGELEIERTYANNVYDGITKFYTKSGIITNVYNYVNNKLQGTQYTYYSDTGSIRTETEYVDSVIHGKKQEYYPSGADAGCTVYENGNLVGNISDSGVGFVATSCEEYYK
ncbi:MAG: hypothetical protein DRG78_22855, partial [Epsilonproteobacteria bacterium]